MRVGILGCLVAAALSVGVGSPVEAVEAVGAVETVERPPPVQGPAGERLSNGSGRDPLAGARLLPAGRRVQFVLGQDGGTLRAFRSAVIDQDRQFPVPSGVSLFTSINGATPLNGLWSSVDYGVGPTQFEDVLSSYGGVLTIGLELIDYSQKLDTADRNLSSKAIAGDPSVPAATVRSYRRWVDELVRYARSTGRPVYLKIGYEFDGHWNQYDPASYRGAFRYVAGRIRELGARNVATVWQSAAWGAQIPQDKTLPYQSYESALAVSEGRAARFWDQWYPGDDAVDWLGISQFATENYAKSQWACPRTRDQEVVPPRSVQNAFLEYARAHRKPVMIAESAPQGYDLGKLTAACIFAEGQPWVNSEPVTARQVWDEWFRPTFAYIRDNQDIIRSVTYINTNWNSQDVWKCTGPTTCGSGYWGDTRLEANPTILALVKRELRSPRYTPGPRRVARFEGPDFSVGPGVYQAEYAEGDTWLGCCGRGALPEVRAGASNGREVVVMNFGDSGAGTYGVGFGPVRAGTGIDVTHAGPLTGPASTITVLVNGVAVGRPIPLASAGPGVFRTDHVAADVPARATVRVVIDPNAGGNLAYLDKIAITR
jgi:hypothetical protein